MQQTPSVTSEHLIKMAIKAEALSDITKEWQKSKKSKPSHYSKQSSRSHSHSSNSQKNEGENLNFNNFNQSHGKLSKITGQSSGHNLAQYSYMTPLKVKGGVDSVSLRESSKTPTPNDKSSKLSNVLGSTSKGEAILGLASQKTEHQMLIQRKETLIQRLSDSNQLIQKEIFLLKQLIEERDR